MENKNKPFLKFYEKSMKTGQMYDNYGIGGMCGAFLGVEKRNDRSILDLLSPGLDEGYWGYDGRRLYEEDCKKLGITRDDLLYKFTPLRQTIILFCAAINGELD